MQNHTQVLLGYEIQNNILGEGGRWHVEEKRGSREKSQKTSANIAWFQVDPTECF